jgi:hypothetical protein
LTAGGLLILVSILMAAAERLLGDAHNLPQVRPDQLTRGFLAGADVGLHDRPQGGA